MSDAPGAPGLSPRWTTSAKEGLGTALSPTSRVWFTLSHGILNEIYYPRVDQACTRDFGFMVAGDDGYFSEEKRATERTLETVAPGVLAYRLSSRCPDGRYQLDKEIVCDPGRDVVLQRVRFRQFGAGGLRLYALLSPHLVNGGADNSAWLDTYKGNAMLFASGDGTSLALAASSPFRTRSVGFVGASDGWQQVSRDGRIAEAYDRASGGNVALTAELAVDGPETTMVLALGFGRAPSEAAFRAHASLQDRFDDLRDAYVAGWRGWQDELRPLEGPAQEDESRAYRLSAAVLRCHESPTFPGGLIASLSIPWGSAKGDDDLGGYHLVWPRDLVQTAGGFLAAGAHAEALRVLRYLRATQEGDGHWAQNTWLDGTPYWNGVQLDETAFPILLVDMLIRAEALPPADLPQYWPMVRDAASFVARTGPTTGQDRWEEDGGYSPFTLAAAISGLLAAATIADRMGEAAAGGEYRAVADTWYEGIDGWTYATDTPLAREVGVEGYYVRISPETTDGSSPLQGSVAIRNRPDDHTWTPAWTTVSPDALALVRFGLRRADDPRILNTVKVIDALLKVEFPAGSCWRRYNGDGYGEHEDGSAFDGTGVGRAWPLLTGERAHYELAAGRIDAARTLLATLQGLTSAGGLMPEQVWDADDIVEKELFRGKPSGSAMPLVWAHAEHIKLLRSIADGAVFDLPPAAAERYLGRG